MKHEALINFTEELFDTMSMKDIKNDDYDLIDKFDNAIMKKAEELGFDMSEIEIVADMFCETEEEFNELEKHIELDYGFSDYTDDHVLWSKKWK